MNGFCAGSLLDLDCRQKGRKGYVVDHIVPLECGGRMCPRTCSGRPSQKQRLRTQRKEIAAENSLSVTNSHGPGGPPPRMKELRLTAGWLLFENHWYEEKWPV